VEWGLPPVADLYPDATVMFADIAGFTSWSSVREPTQVFTLLETLYGAFDAIAKGEVFSKSRRYLHMLPWWVFPPKGSCGCNGQVRKRLSRRNDDSDSQARSHPGAWTPVI
jgi:hypothetical protein